MEKFQEIAAITKAKALAWMLLMDVAAGCLQPNGGHLTMTLPVTASAQGVAHAQADAGSKANAAPARVARDYLVTHPDASENPFGKLVSQFAKGELPG